MSKLTFSQCGKLNTYGAYKFWRNVGYNNKREIDYFRHFYLELVYENL